MVNFEDKEELHEQTEKRVKYEKTINDEDENSIEDIWYINDTLMYITHQSSPK